MTTPNVAATAATLDAPKTKAVKPKKNVTEKPAKTAAPPKAKAIKVKSGGIGAGDDARAVARASNGKLDTDQVRVLRFLRKVAKPVDRADLKDGVGIGRANKYSSGWLKSLWALQEASPALVKIEKHEPEAGQVARHTHRITPAGVKAVEKAEAAYAAATAG